MRWKRDDLIREYNELYFIHHGNLHTAAQMLDMNKESLERALYRARAAGIEVRWTGMKY